MTRSKALFSLLLLAAVGLMIAGCSSTPLPPVLVMAAPTPLGGAPGTVEQPAAAQAVAMATAAPSPTAEPSPTPAEPTATATAEPTATSEPTAAPTTAPSSTPTSEPTAARAPATATATRAALAQAATATALPTRVPTRAPARTVAPTATPTPEWPKTLVITEADIEQQAAASAVPGLQIAGLNVDFGNDTMTVSFDSLRYSLVSLRNVTVEGHFEVSNCDVNFVADSIRPRNLATSSIPGFVNQALDQSLGTWCVDTLSIAPGQMVVQVQPR